MNRMSEFYTSKELNRFSLQTLHELHFILNNENVATRNKEVLCDILHLKVPRYLAQNIMENELVLDQDGFRYRVKIPRFKRHGITCHLIKDLEGDWNEMACLQPVKKILPFYFGPTVTEEQQDELIRLAFFIDQITLNGKTITLGGFYVIDSDFADYLIDKLENE